MKKSTVPTDPRLRGSRAPAPVQLLPPPPPPPGAAPTVPVAPAAVPQAPVHPASVPSAPAPPVLTVPPTIQATPPVYAMASTPMIKPSPIAYPVLFDPSVPPPPIPAVVQPTTMKHSSTNDIEAVAAKRQKLEECDVCAMWKLRAELCRRQLEELQRAETARRAEFDTLGDEYESGRALLRSLLSPLVFKMVDEYIDSNPQPASNPLILQLLNHAMKETSPLETLLQRSMTATPTESTRLIRTPDYQGFTGLLERLTNGMGLDSRTEALLRGLSRDTMLAQKPSLAGESTLAREPALARESLPTLAREPLAPAPVLNGSYTPAPSAAPPAYLYPPSHSTPPYYRPPYQ